MIPVVKTSLLSLVPILMALGGAWGSISLSDLINKADDVVVGNVTAVTPGSITPMLTLKIRRTLKGTAAPTTEITVALSQETTLPQGISEKSLGALVGKTGVWFLKQDGSNLVIQPLVTGYVDVTNLCIQVPDTELPAKYAYAADADPSKKLAFELAAAALDSTTAEEIVGVAEKRMLDRGLGTDLLQLIFADLASSSQNSTKSIGVAGQIRAGQPSALSALTGMPLSTFSFRAQALLTRSVCEYRGTDSSGIQALANLSETAYSSQMKACAAHALREIHTKDTLVPLRNLLDSPVANIRYDAVIGIAQFALKFPPAAMEQKPVVMSTFRPDANATNEMRRNYPTTGLFAQNEQQYITYWKNWLDQHPVP